jgi:hypothetical protein
MYLNDKLFSKVFAVLTATDELFSRTAKDAFGHYVLKVYSFMPSLCNYIPYML